MGSLEQCHERTTSVSNLNHYMESFYNKQNTMALLQMSIFGTDIFEALHHVKQLSIVFIVIFNNIHFL